MRGARVKRLRRLYQTLTGKKPEKAIWVLSDDGKRYEVRLSQERTFRKEFGRARRRTI